VLRYYRPSSSNCLDLKLPLQIPNRPPLGTLIATTTTFLLLRSHRVNHGNPTRKPVSYVHWFQTPFMSIYFMGTNHLENFYIPKSWTSSGIFPRLWTGIKNVVGIVVSLALEFGNFLLILIDTFTQAHYFTCINLQVQFLSDITFFLTWCCSNSSTLFGFAK